MAKFFQVALLLTLGLFAVSAQSTCPRVIPRGGWNARELRTVPVLPIRPAPLVIVHPTGTASCSTQAECSEIIRNIQDFQTQANGWADISYHFLIGGDNRIYAGRGWGRMGENVEGFSNQAINIGYIGRFNDAAPNAEAAALLDELVNCGIAERALSANVRVVAQCQAVRFVTCEATRIFSWISEHPRFVATPRPI